MENFYEIYYRLNILLCEPTTAITDVLLSFYSFYLCKKTLSFNKQSEFNKHWAYFFAFFGCSTFIGGLAHSTSCLYNTLSYNICWLLMQVSAGISLFFAQQAVIATEIVDQKIRQLSSKLALLQLICFVFCVFIFRDFKVVALNSLIGLIQLILLCFPKTNHHWEYKTLLSLGFMISFITVYVNRNQLGFSYWFNHNDISHVIMFISLWHINKGLSYKYHFYKLQKSKNSIKQFKT